MESYVIIANWHRDEVCLLLEEGWNDAIASGNFALTCDNVGDLMYVVRYFDAASFDEARVIYDAWANENI